MCGVLLQVKPEVKKRRRRKSQMLVRIAPDVETMVVAAVKESNRSVPREVNHVLRGVYRSAITLPSLSGQLEYYRPDKP